MRQRRRRRALRLGALTAATLPLAAALALAAAPPSKPIVLPDAGDDTSGALDIQRASLSLGADGRLRAVVTFAAKVTPKDLLAKTGPPGSACLRIWTAPDADPTATRPDRLVCVTADKDAKLRAGVYEQRDAGLPRRTAPAAVTVNSSGRSFVIRVSQSALGRPALIRFAFESTRPGCDRTSCIDTVPDGGATRRFRLHAG
jgi:hypothetical protein